MILLGKQLHLQGRGPSGDGGGWRAGLLLGINAVDTRGL